MQPAVLIPEIFPPKKPKGKVKKWVWRCVWITLGILILFNIALHPLLGNFYHVVGIDKNQIQEVKIWHYGKTVNVTDKQTVKEIINLFDCNARRGQSDYIMHSNGGDWSITFTANGKTATVMLYPSYPSSAGTSTTQMFYNHYHYSLDNEISIEKVQEIWDRVYK